MAGPPNVRLNFLNRPENVLLVRQALNGMAEALGMDALELNDVTTAVTEACNNVVLHAYSGGEGPLEIELSAPEGGVEVIVRDRGIGIRPGAHAAEHVSRGIGLPVIHALAERVELREIAGGGTEVEMHFTTSSSRGFGQPERHANGLENGEHETTQGSDTALLTVAPAPVAGSVLPRVLCALAARAYFPTDRISDAQTLTEALLAHVEGSASAGQLKISISAVPHNLELRIGPLARGRGAELLAAAQREGTRGSLTPVLERLKVGHEVTSSNGTETLALRLAGERPA